VQGVGDKLDGLARRHHRAHDVQFERHEDVALQLLEVAASGRSEHGAGRYRLNVVGPL
jgi:hypothetical protein